ncbi:MAG: hypothetical protein NTW06_00825 [Candidatus Falkowbacteria bacterium]|nr:hypothetical protein [Candidatus Falkowbacteria bacterium]
MNDATRETMLRYLDVVAKAAGFGEPKSITEIIGAVIGVFLSLLGIIFLILVLYAGFTWMTSLGNEYKVRKAKDTLIQATIGIIIIISAYAITYSVFNALQNTLQ